ncbi:TIM barrel protein [Subtercola lobariae]|nr:TIM barrel protein [Subtercola lobariae]
MSILLADVPLLERPALARRLGYESVESWWPWAHEVASRRELAAFAGSLEAAGTQLLLLNVCEGDAQYGGRGLAGVVGADDAFWRNWESVLALAERTGARHINVLVGDSARAAPVASARRGDSARAARAAAPGAGAHRGDPRLLGSRIGDRSAAGSEHGDTLARLTERLAVLADQAHEVGAGVVIEQLNRFDHANYLLTDPDDAVLVTRRARSASKQANIGLLSDVYHLARAGTDPASFVAAHADLVRHVQLADDPGRGRPGTGTIPIRETLDTLAITGYDGMIGLEYTPGPDELAALARPAELWRSLREPVPQGDHSA